jgi:predicted nucleic acid-binding protein
MDDRLLKVYLDNMIVSGLVRRDLRPVEMEATLALVEYERRGAIQIVTSRESWREQQRTKDPNVRDALRRAESDVPVVAYDHEVLGAMYMPDRYGGFISSPAITDIIDQPLFDDLKGFGVDDADARHLMYAARNDCDRFVTLDPYLLERREQIESRCGKLQIVKPSEFLAKLSLNTR